MAQLGAGYAFEAGETITGIAWSNAAVGLSGTFRIEYHDGTLDEVRFDLASVPSTRVGTVLFPNYVAKKRGRVLGGIIVGGGTLQRGQCYVQVLITNADTTVSRQVLAAGYQYAGHVVTVGEIVEPGPAGGHGNYREIQTSDPAAGSEVPSTAVPTGTLWRLLAFDVALVQGITQTPLPTLKFNASLQQAYQIPITTTAISANSTAQLTWAKGIVQSSFTGVVGDEFHTAPLPDMVLNAGDTIVTATDGIGANTNYGAALLYIEEWVMPN